MQVLARQNIFKVHKAPDSTRQNKFLESTTVSRQSSGKKGIQITRNSSIDFDQLYNPYRLKELGSYQSKFSTPYKSLQSKEVSVQNWSTLKCIRLGQKEKNCEKVSAERSDSTVTEYFKNQANLLHNVKKTNQMQNILSESDCSFLSWQSIHQDMFGNIEKINSSAQSFVSFTSEERPSTVYLSIISGRAT